MFVAIQMSFLAKDNCAIRMMVPLTFELHCKLERTVAVQDAHTVKPLVLYGSFVALLVVIGWHCLLPKLYPSPVEMSYQTKQGQTVLDVKLAKGRDLLLTINMFCIPHPLCF